MAEEWLTTAEAAELTGFHKIHLRRLMRAGKVKGKKFGPTWQVSRRSLLDYIEAAERSKDKRRGPKDKTKPFL